PPDWPSTAVTYLAVPSPSAQLPKDARLTYCSPPLVPVPNQPPKLEIRKIIQKSHPAFGEFGLFYVGKHKLEKGTWIRDYLGYVHTEPESSPTSSYDLSLHRSNIPSSSIAIDATSMGNESRFINDYRRILEKPNAEFETREWELPGARGKAVRMSVWAGPKGIGVGEEICVSYGKGFWQERSKEKEKIEKKVREWSDAEGTEHA
ncbi:hypothetical protein T439DRAFT_293127, partial [Meredithblackwellia eburnea MCA 4105]